jgi:hypothetical protein
MSIYLGGKMFKQILKMFLIVTAVIMVLTLIVYAAVPQVQLDSPPDGFTTTARSVDLTATVTDDDGDPLTVNFYGGTSSPPDNVLYTEENVPSGTQITYTWSNPVLQSDANTVALWHFDEGSGSVVSDASGNGNDGTIGGATWTNDGKFGPALQFDGENDFVRVADNASLDLTEEVTVEAWIRGQGADYTSVTQQTNIGYGPQFQILGDTLFCVFSNSSQIFTGRMNILDGTGWTVTQRTSGGGTKHHPQMQIAGDSLWCIWRETTGSYWQHWLGCMNIDGSNWSYQQLSYDATNHY